MHPLSTEPGKNEGRAFALVSLFLQVFGLVLFDQLSKWWAGRSLSPGESVALIPGIFHLTLHQNAGAAFGLFADQPFVLTLVTVLFDGGVAFFVVRSPAPAFHLQCRSSTSDIEFEAIDVTAMFGSNTTSKPDASSRTPRSASSECRSAAL